MKRIGILVASFLTIVSLSVTQPVFAASNGLGVNPRRDYTVKAGEKVTDKLVITNLSKTDALSVKVEIIDFKAENETGSPSLQLDAKEPTKWSLKNYLTLPASVNVPAGKSADVPFTISIPSNVGAGSYYSAIRYSAVGDTSGQNVNLASSSVSLMFVRVPGDARSSLILEQMGAFNRSSDGKTGSFAKFFSATSPEYISYRLRNTGNVAEQPQGSLLLTDIFGKKVKLFNQANPNNNIVLIDQTRRIDLCLNEQRTTKKDDFGRDVEDVKCNKMKLAPGRYTAKLALTYGNEGGSTQEIHGSATFWYLPVWFIVAVVAGLALIAFLVWRVVKMFQNRGAHKYRGRK